MKQNRLNALSLLLFALILPSSSLNISTIFLSSISEPPPPPSPSSQLLKGVLKAIALRQSWKLGDVRVTNTSNSRIGDSQKYDFLVQMGKTNLLIRFSDEVDSWRKLHGNGEFGELLSEINTNRTLKKLRLDGPFELRVVGDDDELKLQLPLNISHSGLKRLIVGEGITVFVEGAREISLSHISDFGLPYNRSTEIKERRNHYWPFRHSSCVPLPPIQILGSSSLLAYKTRNPSANIKTTFLSRDMIELLPEKCFSGTSTKRRAWPINALSKRLDLLEKVMKRLTGGKPLQNGISSYLKVKISTSTLVRFVLELERDIRDDDAFWGTLAEWRTKPTIEQIQYEVVARVEGERLMPLVIKKVRPFIAADSAAWSALMSNISFTKFPSEVGFPEALTLDVKW